VKDLRSALLIATASRYLSLTANFLTLAVLSRLLTPHEIGLSIVGTAICGFWFRLREFTTPNFLILRNELNLDDVRATFTTSFILSALLCLVLNAAVGGLASLYEQHELIVIIRISSLAFFIEVFTATIIALFQRELAFGKVALVGITNAAITGVGTIIFAMLGLSYISPALGWLVGTFVSVILAVILKRDLDVFRPLMKNWGTVLGFGFYNGINVFLAGVYETVPLILLGKLISAGTAADYSRSLNIVQLPDNLFLAGVIAVALPAFADQVRQGNDLKAVYVGASLRITAIQWPALVLISILSYPIVSIVLGRQWDNVASLVQIMALGYVFSFSAALNYPVLVSLGGMREVLLRALTIWPISALIVSGGAFFGMTAVAFSFWVALGFQAFVSTRLVQRHIRLDWGELVASLCPSFVVTICTAAGALAVIALWGFRFDLSICRGAVAGLAGAAGWYFGLLITKHPLLGEIRNTLRVLRGIRPFSRYFLDMRSATN
jgi:O-antigen/teichoic acid export membrane protein